MSEALRLADDAAHLAAWLRRRSYDGIALSVDGYAEELRRLHAVEQERDALKAEMQKLRADAERYRWLFSDTNLASLMENGPPANPVHSEVVAEIVGVYMTKAQADMLVDAAMKGATP